MQITREHCTATCQDVPQVLLDTLSAGLNCSEDLSMEDLQAGIQAALLQCNPVT